MRRFLNRACILAGISLSFALIGLTAWLFVLVWRPATADFPVQGAYVSAEQGPIDWFTLRANGASFAYIVATTGVEQPDHRFSANWAGSFQADVRHGAVHRFSLCRLARDQAWRFTRIVPASSDALPAALELHFRADCRARPERRVVIGEIETFLRIAEAHTGKPMILKIAPSFERHYQVSRAIRRPLWAEQSFYPPEYLTRPWQLWQASSLHRVAGANRTLGWVVATR